MKYLNFATFILAGAIGLYDLTKKREITRGDYAIIWALLMLNEISDLL